MDTDKVKNSKTIKENYIFHSTKFPILNTTCVRTHSNVLL